jgi:hypothetical protein
MITTLAVKKTMIATDIVLENVRGPVTAVITITTKEATATLMEVVGIVGMRAVADMVVATAIIE